MTDSEEAFREDIREACRRHDPKPQVLREVAQGMELLAEKWESAGEAI